MTEEAVRPVRRATGRNRRQEAADAAYHPNPATVRIDTGDEKLDAELADQFTRLTSYKPLGTDEGWRLQDLSARSAVGDEAAAGAAGSAAAPAPVADTVGYMRGVNMIISKSAEGVPMSVTCSDGTVNIACRSRDELTRALLEFCTNTWTLKAEPDVRDSSHEQPRWVRVGDSGGALCLWGRPSDRKVDLLRSHGCTLLVTVMSPRELAKSMNRIAAKAGADWLWIKCEGARLSLLQDTLPSFRKGLQRVVEEIRAGGRVCIHCAAGMHRTGFSSYIILRMLGYSPAEAKVVMWHIRKITMRGVGSTRLALAESLVTSIFSEAETADVGASADENIVFRRASDDILAPDPTSATDTRKFREKRRGGSGAKPAQAKAKTDREPRKPRAIDAIGARMKGYEREAETASKLNHLQPVVARIDGHKFSTFTKGFRRPFDERLHNAMVQTAQDLLTQFDATTAYTQSDEITLIWPACTEEQTPMYGGRITKIATLLAGFTSVRFAHHMQHVEWEDDGTIAATRVRAKLADPLVHFDARVFNVPSTDEAYINVMWRAGFDCPRNAMSTLARAHFSHKELQGLSTAQMTEKLADERGVLWSEQPAAFKCGTSIKREMCEVEAMNRKTGERVLAVRTCTVARCVEYPKHMDEGLRDMLFEKFWPIEDAVAAASTPAAEDGEATATNGAGGAGGAGAAADSLS